MFKKYRVLGVMSGTSLDGVDLALCTFKRSGNKWSFLTEGAITVPYNRKWKKILSEAHLSDAANLLSNHSLYGKFLGTLCKVFLNRGGYKNPDFISSHGHTIFHQPDAGFTFQLGNGSAIAAASGLPVISDFRNLDVQLGGQGAPLVPVGDKLLFHQYDVCVNLGGIANLSFDQKGKRLAWDICFVNMGLNFLAGKIGRSFDPGGKIAASGFTDPKLLNLLLGVASKMKGKNPSLAREHFEKFLIPLIGKASTPEGVRNLLRTFTEYAAISVSRAILKAKGNHVLLTGGGAKNLFLVERIRFHCGAVIRVETGSEEIIDFKEAIIFAFLGVLKKEGLNNALRTVTGASTDSSGGVCTGF
jgi:anhydro-N-acetylmuramic acid kinase